MGILGKASWNNKTFEPMSLSLTILSVTEEYVFIFDKGPVAQQTG